MILIIVLLSLLFSWLLFCIACFVVNCIKVVSFLWKLSVYVYAYGCMWAYLYTCVYSWMYIYVYRCLFLCTSMHIYMFVCGYVLVLFHKRQNQCFIFANIILRSESQGRGRSGVRQRGRASKHWACCPPWQKIQHYSFSIVSSDDWSGFHSPLMKTHLHSLFIPCIPPLHIWTSAHLRLWSHSNRGKEGVGS